MDILIVDDSISLADVMSEMFKFLGYESLAFYSYPSYQSFINSTSYKPLACFFDYNLGNNYTGKDCLNLLKNRFSDVPVYLMSGDFNLDVNQLLNLGFTEVHFKPLRVGTLKVILENLKRGNN